MSVPDRRARLDRAHPALSIRRQCQLLGVARSDVYRTPSPGNDNDLALMRRIDELFTAWLLLASRGWRRCCEAMAMPSIASGSSG
jgi:putative transposase